MALLVEYVLKAPESYADEVGERLTHFLELNKLIRLQPSMHRMELKPMLELTTFLTSVAFCYPGMLTFFITIIFEACLF